jgi:hypothetical protein
MEKIKFTTFPIANLIKINIYISGERRFATTEKDIEGFYSGRKIKMQDLLTYCIEKCRKYY